ncbi:hypothetical protein CBR_g72672 [Chara braunii]|uniref:Uncharacterized protein n=1 Tax=Chara braunii TaxID=69332 RepID=A0A388KA65_CHABU|nr:hypothetical protein CBR_g72672 [Chara braunii]|eukprot:GBG66917.1 hypothetical protein CBR_g72672 [Chara braunii]
MSNSAQRNCRFMSATACSTARVKVMDVGHGSSTGTPRRRSAIETVSTESSKAVKQGGRVWQSKSHNLDAGSNQGQVTKNRHGVWELSRVKGGSVDFDHRPISSERRRILSSSEALHGSCLSQADCQHPNSVGHGQLDCRQWWDSGESRRDLERGLGKPDRNGIWGSQGSLRLDGKQLSTTESSVKKISSANGVYLRYKGQKCGAVTSEQTICQSDGQYPQNMAANPLEHARDDKDAFCESNGCDREPHPAAGRRLKADAVNISKAGPKSSRISFSRGENTMRDLWLRQSVPGSLPSRTAGLSKSYNHGLGLTDAWQRLSDPAKRVMESSHTSEASRRLSHPPNLQKTSSGNVFDRLAASPTVQSLARERGHQDKAPLLPLQGQGLSRSLTVPVAVRTSVLSQSTMALPVSSRAKNCVLAGERRLGSQSEAWKAGRCPTSDKQMRDRLSSTPAVTRRKMRSVSPPAVRSRRTLFSLSAVPDRSKRASDVHGREALSSRPSTRSSSSGLKRISLRRAPGLPDRDEELSLSLTLKTHVLMEEKDSELYWDGCRWMVKFMRVEKPSDHHRAPFCGLATPAGMKVDGSEALSGGTRMRRSSYEKGNKVPPPIIEDRIKSVNDNSHDQQGRGRGSSETRRRTSEPANRGEYVFAQLDAWRDKKDEAHTQVAGVNAFTGGSGLVSTHNFAGDILCVDDGDPCVTTMTEEDMDDVGEMSEEGRHDGVEAQPAFELLTNHVRAIAGCQGMKTFEEVTKVQKDPQKVGAIAGCQGMKTLEEVTKVQKDPQNVDGLECTQTANSSLLISSCRSEGIVHIRHGEGEVNLDAVKRSAYHNQLSVEAACDAHRCEDICNAWEGQPSPVSALDFPGSEDEASPLMRRGISSRDGSEDIFCWLWVCPLCLCSLLLDACGLFLGLAAPVDRLTPGLRTLVILAEVCGAF